MPRTLTSLRLSFVALAIATVTGFTALRMARSDDQPMLVSTEWVAERLGDPDLVLLHVGNDTEYAEGHIPGAVHITFPMISATRDGLNLQLLPVEELERNLEALGVSDDSHIVIYVGSTWMTASTRVYLTLDYLGLGERTSIMNGGLPTWKAEDRPVSSEPVTVKPGDFTPKPRPEVIAQADWVKENLHNPHVAVIDARTQNFYTGIRGGHGQLRAGHILGAGNIPFRDVVDEETMKFKDEDKLREMFAAAGAEPGAKVVTYCHIGQQATLVYFAAKQLGYEVALYDGSFQEWSNREDLPVERPAATLLPQLVSTDKLARMLEEEEGVRVIDMRSSFGDYLAGHVPGAAYLHYETLRATKAGVPADLLSGEAYASIFSELGIRPDRPVVIYSDDRNFNATFLAFLLAGFSHPSVHLLDGGYAKWESEKRPSSRYYPDIEPSDFPGGSFDPPRTGLGMVRWLVENAGTPDGDGMVIVDVRPHDQYTGQAGMQLRRGHIPGAINHIWSSDLTVKDGARVWKPVDQLRASYEAQGITPDKHVILYCNTGTEASHVFFALMSLLDYPNVDVYFPSWTEWSEREELPIESG